MTSGMDNSLYLGNSYAKINRMKRCKSENICILLHDKGQKDILKSLHRSYSCPNFSLELNESNVYSKNKEGEDSKSTISSQYYFNANSFIDKKKRVSVLSSFQSKLNTISYMFAKTSNNLRKFSKNIDNSNNKLETSKDKFSDSIDFHNNEALSMHNEYSFSKNSVRSEFNNRTKFRFKPHHHHHHHHDKYPVANRSNKSNIQLKENENHNLTKMNIFSKSKDYGEMSKSKSSSRLRHGTTMSFRSFKSARTINDQDKSFKSFKSFNNDSLSKPIKDDKKNSISESYSSSSVKTSNDNISNSSEKGRHNKELDKLLHSKQGSIISKNPSIKSKIMRISKISSLKKKGKSLYNELSKEFRSSSTTDEIFPNNSKLTSTDSFSDWFNSISSVPQNHSQASPSSSISQCVSTVSVQSPLSNEIIFDSSDVNNTNDQNEEKDNNDQNKNNNNSLTSTPLSQSFSLNDQTPSDKDDNKKDITSKTTDPIGNTQNMKNQNRKVDLSRGVSISKQLPPLPIGLKYKGDNASYNIYIYIYDNLII